MLKFLAKLKIQKIIKSEEPIYNRGKMIEKSSEKSSYSQFLDLEIHESRAILFETEGRAIANNEETD